ncbi:MAG: redox-regulated ATPase YchF [Acidobacteriia bacterium]|nr:redox-regulated ATPase YchF [Terriglobia bacterium]
MKTGIIGFSQVGKTTLFNILTNAKVDTKFSGGRAEAHLGITTVPDVRLDALARQYNPKKTIHATVEYVDVAGLVKGEKKDREPSFLGDLRNVEALLHVIRAFEDPSSPHPEGSINPRRDIENLELELVLTDLAIVEKRLERLEKDLKKVKNPEWERELELQRLCKTALDNGRPVRSLEFKEEDKKRLRGFMYLSAKPILHCINLGDTDSHHLEEVGDRFNLAESEAQPHVAITAVCGKIESELLELPVEDQAAFLADYGLKQSGLERIIRATYRLLDVISFFTVGEDECRAWTVPRRATAWEAAGAIHTDIQKNFIRAEVVSYEDLIACGSLTVARDKGVLRLEGKEHIINDGDIVHFRHSG